MQISKIHFSGPTLTALYSAFPFLKSTLFDLAKILEESYLCHNTFAKVQCGTFKVGHHHHQEQSPAHHSHHTEQLEKKREREGRQDIGSVGVGQVIDFSAAVEDPSTGLKCVVEEVAVETFDKEQLLTCTHSMIQVCDIFSSLF